MPKCRALFVESYPHVIAGQQKTIRSLADCWKNEFDGSVTFLTPGSGAFVDLAREEGNEVEVVEYPKSLSRYGGAVYRDGLGAKLRVILQTLKYIKLLRRKLKELKPQAMFCNDMRGLLTAGVAARSLGIPVMIWDKLDKPHGILDWFQLPLANRNPVISKAVITKYPVFQQKWYQERIILVPNGADVERFSDKKQIRDEEGVGSNDVVFAIVGTVTERKAQDRILSLWPALKDQLPDAQLWIIGSWEKEDQDYYDALPNKDYDGVRFLGHRTDMVPLMHSIDVLLIPSRHEGMGQVTVEAMVCAKPVIGSNSGGIPEVVVDGETGVIFEGDDSEALMAAMLKLGKDKKLRLDQGEKGRIRAEQNFNRPIQMKKICQLLKDMSEKNH